MPKGKIRVFCKRCQKWYDTTVDTDCLNSPRQGIWSIALNHGDHVLTVFVDCDLRVRGEAMADVVSDENEAVRAMRFFDKI
ncbi:MAG: hypothetical protein QXQ81_04235 [Candidatus Thorarchaeota archaeon]